MLAVSHFSTAEEGRKLALRSMGCFGFGLAEHDCVVLLQYLVCFGAGLGRKLVHELSATLGSSVRGVHTSLCVATVPRSGRVGSGSALGCFETGRAPSDSAEKVRRSADHEFIIASSWLLRSQ